ncbi:MAG: hydrogenase iron-sulfur subunit [Desulfitobacterium hafniense]|nr:hydrogenase iron-sulfur subunit [Desulfitobacterium hafniense]
MPSSVEVLICRCQGSVSGEFEIERLTKQLEKNKRIAKVHVLDHLCSQEGMKKLNQLVQVGEDSGLVVAACAAESLQNLLESQLPALNIKSQLCSIVPVREWVFWPSPRPRATEAAADMIKMAVARVRQVKDVGNWSAKGAVVNRLRCDKCKRCMEECPVDAYSLDEEGYPCANPELCQRCGICVGSCPLQVISLPDLRIEELSSEIRALKGDGSEEPTVLAFCCEPLTYPALQEKVALGMQLPQNMRIIKVPCMGAVNTALISDALSAGVDSVVLLGCEHGPCQQRRGDQLTKRRLENLKETLERMMFEVERVNYIGWPEASSDGMDVDRNICNGCLTCKEVCPYNAVIPEVKAVRGAKRIIAERDPLACRACGICTVACPSGACQTYALTEAQLLDSLDAACSDTVNPVPNEMVVLCNCQGKLSEVINFQSMKDNLDKQGFRHVIEVSQLCTPDAWRNLAKQGSHAALRAVVGACGKSFFGSRFEAFQKEIGLDLSYCAFADLLEKAILWPESPTLATDAATWEILTQSALLRENKKVNGVRDLELAGVEQYFSSYITTLRDLGPNPFKEG